LKRDLKDIISSVRKIELQSRRNSDTLFSGEYHAAFKGSGMRFSEVRPYSYGDDVRNIDWNVSARTGETHIKVFEEERELNVLILVDVSASDDIESKYNKLDYMAEIAASLAFSASTNQDLIALLLYSDKVEKFIPGAKGRNHILRLVRELVGVDATSKGTSLQVALEYISAIYKKRSIIFVLSDFIDQGYEKAWKTLARKHELIAVQVFDPLDERLPDIGMFKSHDVESGEIFWFDSSDAVQREAWKHMRSHYSNIIAQLSSRTDSGCIRLALGQPFKKQFVQYFKLKTKAR